MKQLGIWVEVTTLVVPGENDSEEELTRIAEFVAGVDRNIPWHISRFRPDYKFGDRDATPIETLRKARDIGRAQGLNYVYMGNVLEGTDSLCPGRTKTLINRAYMSTERLNLQDGVCPSCGTKISGVWQ
jgi:pyruvate formate lyase activating enzyme